MTATARSLGSADPRTEQQRRADLVSGILLGRLQFNDDKTDPEADGDEARESGSWVEVEDIGPMALLRRPRTVRIGVVVPLSSLLGHGETAGELTPRRSGSGPAPAGTPPAACPPTVRDGDGVDWTLPDDTRYSCADDPLPTGLDAAA